MSELKKSQIERLNDRARQYRYAGMNNYDAIAQAAADLKVPVLVEGDVCRVYDATDAILVNCWTDEDGSSRIASSMSPDNNISWYTDSDPGL